MEIAFWIMAACCLVVAGFLIPLLIQLKKTAAKVETFAETANRDVILAVQETREAMAALRQSTQEMRDGVQRGAMMMDAVKAFGGRASGVLALAQGVISLVKSARKKGQAGSGNGSRH